MTFLCLSGASGLQRYYLCRVIFFRPFHSPLLLFPFSVVALKHFIGKCTLKFKVWNKGNLRTSSHIHNFTNFVARLRLFFLQQVYKKDKNKIFFSTFYNCRTIDILNFNKKENKHDENCQQVPHK